jgi:hypothetical protein
MRATFTGDTSIAGQPDFAHQGSRTETMYKRLMFSSILPTQPRRHDRQQVRHHWRGPAVEFGVEQTA